MPEYWWLREEEVVVWTWAEAEAEAVLFITHLMLFQQVIQPSQLVQGETELPQHVPEGNPVLINIQSQLTMEAIQYLEHSLPLEAGRVEVPTRDILPELQGVMEALVAEPEDIMIMPGSDMEAQVLQDKVTGAAIQLMLIIQVGEVAQEELELTVITEQMEDRALLTIF